jgi:biotin operon repressor
MSNKITILDYLRQAGRKGATSAELAKKVGQKNVGPIYSHLYRLRKAGHHISQDGDRYYLTGEVTGVLPQDAAEKVVPANGTSKKDVALQLLHQAGKEGMEKHDLSKKLGITFKNLVFHIHALRKKKCQIEYRDGRYYLKGRIPGIFQKNLAHSDGNGSFMSPAPATMPKIQVSEKIIRKLRLLSSDDREDYLDMLKKANFYSMCAEALVSATELTETIKKEVTVES